jgi:hypothetical protein
MRNVLRCVLGSLTLLACAPDPSRAQSAEPKSWAISIVHLEARPSEKVVAFRLNIDAGAVRRLERLPVGWNISIDNDASWVATVRGTVEVGAASLSESDFADFMVVEQNEFGNRAFGLAGEVCLTRDFLSERCIPLKPENFFSREEDRVPPRGVGAVGK